MNQEKIGKFIAEIRKEKNMTQQQLAEKLGVTDKAVSKWENGRGMPDYTIIKSLCNELNISINDLLSGERISKKDYQQKLEENIIKIAAENSKAKNKSLIILAIIFITLSVSFFVYKSIKLNVPYDNRAMICSFNKNTYNYKTLGNVISTIHYKRVVDNNLYLIFHSSIYLDDIHDSKIKYGKNLDMELKEEDYSISYFSGTFDTSHDNVYIYYSEESLNKIKKISNEKFKLELNNMQQMCSLN